MRSDKHRSSHPELNDYFKDRQAEIDAFRKEYEEEPSARAEASSEAASAEHDRHSAAQKAYGEAGGSEETPPADDKAETAAKERAGGSRKPPYMDHTEAEEAGIAQKLPKKSWSRRRIVLTIIIAILIICACGCTGAWYLLHHATSKMEKVNTSYKDFDINARVEKQLKNYENIAILGVDARKNEKIKGSRSDAIIVCSINKKTKDVKMMSIMRDSYLEIEDVNNKKYFDKITHAHAYGGATDTAKALNRNLDLNIQEFLVFNWKAVADMVDALGGITVDIQSNELNDLNQYGQESAKNVGKSYTPITTTGRQTIDGAQAVTYCRIRKTSGGDEGRANRYKRVMSALLKKARKMDSSNLRSVVSNVLPEIQTNVSDSTLLGIMMNASEYTIGKTYSWPPDFYGGLINGTWYAVPTTLQSNVQWLHEKLFGQKDYTLTKRAQRLSQQIIEQSGYGADASSSEGGTSSGTSTGASASGTSSSSAGTSGQSGAGVKGQYAQPQQ
ncbi:MAG: LCP family protein [Eubacteriales bacterium]|nr:LCP family protein [Eubacteriales bacterium]